MSEENDTRELRREVRELRSEVHEIKEDLARYRGAVGGVLVVGTSIVAFAKFVWGFLKEHLVWQ